MSHTISLQSIPQDLLRVTSHVTELTKQPCFLVGGAVRDLVLGQTPKDFDIATCLTPDQLLAVLPDIPGLLPALEIGKSFGVVVVRTEEGGEYEFAMFREDVGEGRRPDGGIRQSDILSDVRRRDFTMNALFARLDDESGLVLDMVGGVKDIENRVVRCVGRASERFQEDPLRVLRAARFATRFAGGTLEESAFLAARSLVMSNGLQGVSSERVFDEFQKGLKSAHSVKAYLELLERLGLLRVVFRGADLVTPVQSVSVFSHDIAVMAAQLLGHTEMSSKQVSQLLIDLKWTGDLSVQTGFLLDFFKMTPETAPSLKKRFQTQVRLSDDWLKEVRLLCVSSDLFDKFLVFLGRDLSHLSQELLDEGHKPGKLLGEELTRRQVLMFLGE